MSDETQTKTCKDCKQVFPLEAFPIHVQNKKGKSYRRTRCPKCWSIEVGWNNVKKKYGITKEQYESLLARQNGGCAICGEPPKPGRFKTRLCVDHDHSTGNVRGLLCDRHNAALGAFGDDLAGLTKAVEYLQRAQQPRRRRIWSLLNGWEEGYGPTRKRLGERTGTTSN